MFCLSPTFSGFCLAGLHFTKKHIEALELCLPELAVFLEPGRRVAKRSRFQSPRPPLRILSARDEPCAFQHLKVFGNGWLGHCEGLRQVHYRGFALGQPGQDSSARRIGERCEGSIKMMGYGWSITVQLHNHKVIYRDRSVKY